VIRITHSMNDDRECLESITVEDISEGRKHSVTVTFSPDGYVPLFGELLGHATVHLKSFRREDDK
jgi:hypothetical protein